MESRQSNFIARSIAARRCINSHFTQRKIVEARALGREVVAVSSVHRISEALSQRVHDIEVERSGCGGQAVLDVHLRRELQPAELRSSQFYREGHIVEFKRDGEVTWAPVTGVRPDGLTACWCRIPPIRCLSAMCGAFSTKRRWNAVAVKN